MSTFSYCSSSLWGSILFSVFFRLSVFPFLRLGNFYLAAFKFTDYILSPIFCCLVHPVNVFKSDTAFFRSRISICSFYSFRVSGGIYYIISHNKCVFLYFVVIVIAVFKSLVILMFGSFCLMLNVFPLENGLHFPESSYVE